MEAQYLFPSPSIHFSIDTEANSGLSQISSFFVNSFYEYKKRFKGISYSFK